MKIFFRPKTPKKLFRLKTWFFGVKDIVTKSHSQVSKTVFRALSDENKQCGPSILFHRILEKIFDCSKSVSPTQRNIWWSTAGWKWLLVGFKKFYKIFESFFRSLDDQITCRNYERFLENFLNQENGKMPRTVVELLPETVGNLSRRRPTSIWKDCVPSETDD